MARTRLLDPEEYQKIKLTKRTFFLFPYILIQMVIKLVIIFIILIFKSIIKSIIKFVNVIFRTNPIEYRCKVCGYPVYIRRKIIGGYQAALKKEYDGHCTACGAFYEKFNKKQNRLYNNAISHIAYVDNDGYKRFLPKENFESIEKLPIERYAWFASFTLLFLTLESLLYSFKKTKSHLW